MKQIYKFLGWLGGNYCSRCGSKLTCAGTHGYYDEEIYYCANCPQEGGD